MTACRNKARGAVVAALAGALTLGAAPVMALADGASLMATTDDVFEKGTVNYDDGGKAGDTYAYDDEGHSLVPESVTDFNGTEKTDVKGLATDNTGREADTYYFYVRVDPKGNSTLSDAGGAVQYKNDKGALVDLKYNGGSSINRNAKPTETGTYAVVVGKYDSGTWTYVNVADTFTITGSELADAKLCVKGDADDYEFHYTGENGCDYWDHAGDDVSVKDGMSVSIDGVELKEGRDFSFAGIVEKGTLTDVSTGTLTPGKTYVVTVAGDGAYAGDSVELEFTYGKLDLGSAVVVSKGSSISKPSLSLSGVVTKIDDVAVGDISSYVSDNVDVTVEDGPSATMSASGEYTIKIAAKADAKYVTGETTVKFVYADEPATIQYDGKAWTTAFSGNALTVDLGAEKPAYNALLHSGDAAGAGLPPHLRFFS